MATKKNDSGRGKRDLKVKVKTARGRKLSSTLWLQRQLNDPYVQKAKAEGYASRAAYKLIEMDDRYDLLKPGLRIVDLGAAPGGWCQVAAARVDSKADDIRVVGIDYLDMDPVPGATILKKDFLDDDAPEALIEALRDALVETWHAIGIPFAAERPASLERSEKVTPLVVSLMVKWDPLGPAYYVVALCGLSVLIGVYLRGKGR